MPSLPLGPKVRPGVKAPALAPIGSSTTLPWLFQASANNGEPHSEPRPPPAQPKSTGPSGLAPAKVLVPNQPSPCNMSDPPRKKIPWSLMRREPLVITCAPAKTLPPLRKAALAGSWASGTVPVRAVAGRLFKPAPLP